MRKLFIAGSFVFVAGIYSYAQEGEVMMAMDSSYTGINQWHLLDQELDGVPGVSANRAYSELLAGKKSTPVIVAIIDSGTETFHEDLRDNIWVNEDEIADNGIDDDHNGYVDDIHGWSFIGGAKGDVAQDNLEFTRVYRGLKTRFEKVLDAKGLPDADKKDYERYLKMKKEYEGRLKAAEAEMMNYTMLDTFLENADKAIQQALGKETYTAEDVMSIEANDEFMQAAQGIMLLTFQDGFEQQLSEAKAHAETSSKYQLNLDFDPRYMVGDHYEDVNEHNYGNNHIDGPEAEHGTHVGGIVGAVRNDFGMSGIADNARLMIIRCVPDGDERDKDVANSIRYASDNGARVINMSFGKSLSPQKAVIDEAVKYAESKGVLLIHAAGNDDKDVDVQSNFPEANYLDGAICKTWMEIGASDADLDNLKADFSNYGKKSVDVFAPGVNIYSTVPGGQYKDNSGTSMAAPVVTGVAAALLSYYPNLTALEAKDILMKSATDHGDAAVYRVFERKGLGKFFAKIFISKKKSEMSEPPSREYKRKKTKFSSYSSTGGVVNLYQAVKLAEQRSKK